MEFWNQLSEALKLKGFSAAQIKKLQELFGSLNAAELLNTPADKLLPAITGRTLQEKQEKIQILMEIVKEIQQRHGGGSNDNIIMIQGQLTGLARDTIWQMFSVGLVDPKSSEGNSRFLSQLEDLGKFKIEIFKDQWPLLFRVPESYFWLRVYWKGQSIYTTREIFRISPGANSLPLKVNLPEAAVGRILTITSPNQLANEMELTEVSKAAKLPARAQTQLKQAKITSLGDLFSTSATTALKNITLTRLQTQRLFTIGRWTILSGDVSLATKLANSRFDTLDRLSNASADKVQKRLEKEGILLNEEEKITLDKLIVHARASTNLISDAIIDHAHPGNWFKNPDPVIDSIRLLADEPDSGTDQLCTDCDDCANVFSPLAYAYDLVTFIESNWGLKPQDVEKLILQDIDIDCVESQEPIPQIILAIEVLERYLKEELSSPFSGNQQWRNKYWEYAGETLQLLGLHPNASTQPSHQQSLYALSKRSNPILKDILDLIEQAKNYHLTYIANVSGIASAPPQNPDDLANAVYFDEKMQAEAESARLSQAFGKQLQALVAPILISYRENLIFAAGNQEISTLEQRLFIDLRMSPCQSTTRSTQIIQSMQSFILAIRTRAIKENNRTIVSNAGIDTEHFDEASWNWLQTYSAWNAAMYVLVYPENLLSPPTQRRRMTSHFHHAIQRLAGGNASAVAASEMHQDYPDLFRSASQLEALTSHVIGNELVIFAKSQIVNADQSRQNSLWLNRLSTTSLSEVPADGSKVDASAGGWFEVIGWPAELIPSRVLPYDRDNKLMFIALSYKGSDSQSFDSWKTFRLTPEGRVVGEAPIGSSLPDAPGTDPSSSFWGLSTNSSYSHDPTIWARTFTKQNNITSLHYFRASLNMNTGTWNPWQYHGNPLSVDGNLEPWFNNLGSVIVNKRPCYVWRKDTMTVTIRSRSFPAEATGSPSLDIDKALVSPVESSVQLAWNRDTPESYLILREPQGGIAVKRVSVNNNNLDMAHQKVVTIKLDSFAAAEPWPVGSAYGQLNPATPAARHVLVSERYLYFPLLAGWALNRAGDYVSAHAWYRKLYDPFSEPCQVFPFDAFFQGALQRPDDWLSGIDDPDAIANRRGGSYLRHTILMMTKNLLDWADHEFALNLVESRNRARELYLLASQVLQSQVMENPCKEQLQALEFEVAHRLAGTRSSDGNNPKINQVKMKLVLLAIQKLRQINFPVIIEEVKTKINDLLQQDISLQKFELALSKIVNGALKESQERKGKSDSLQKRFSDEKEIREQLESALHPDWSKNVRGTQAGRVTSPRIGSVTAVFCIPKNPLLLAFHNRIVIRLELLRNCLDINGEPSQVQLMVSLQGRIINTFGQLQGLAVGAIESPRYRYDFLIEKARQHASLAQQLASLMLSAIEKRDNAALALLQAEIAEEVAAATITLRALSRGEALQAIQIANIQLSQANMEVNFWKGRVGNGMSLMGVGGLNESEMAGMALMGASGALQGMVALGYLLMAGPAAFSAGIGAITSSTGAAGGVATSGTGVGAAAGAGLWGVGLSAALAGFMAGSPMILSGLQAAAGSAGTFGSLALTFASFERRWEEWQHQYELANIGAQLADAQLNQTQFRVKITEQEQAIAELQHGHARLIIDYLKNRFSNEQLYQWMIGVLQEAYRNVMQNAANTARLAQRSLEFERQQPITVIQGDYWTIDEAALSEEQQSSGLLGAERLLADMSHLDEWKNRTDTRRLELSKTISLSQMLPSEFMKLRETGAINFSTLMEWFDWDFPGHYMRLIRSVKVSVIALIPPVDGIHATLSNNGFSRVVVKGGMGFEEMDAIQRFPETVALDSPINDSGVFVLDYKDPMLLPFEGLGVATGWRFELPMASNRLNFDSMVDVLFTIEYTAFQSAEYRSQVITRLGKRKSMDMVISLRNNYPDQWYDLHNPEDESVDQTITINLPAWTFPKISNNNIGIRYLMMLLLGPSGKNRSGVVSIQKAGVTPALAVNTDENGAFSTRDSAGVDSAGLPRTVFAINPANPDTLLSPVSGDNAQLLDPRGEWQLMFKQSWFSTSNGKRAIDELSDIILIPTIEHDIIWP